MDYAHLSDSDLDALLAKSAPKGSYDHLSDEQLNQMLRDSEPKEDNRVAGFLSEKLNVPIQDVKDLGTLSSRDLTLGAAPAAAGVGAAAGAFSGTRGGLGDKWQAAKDAYFEGRGERRQEEEAAAERSPTMSKITTGAGLLATAPLAAGANAYKVGAGLGAIRAASEGEELSDVPYMVAQGAGLGKLGEAAGGAIGKGLQKVPGAARAVGEQLGKLPGAGAVRKVGNAIASIPKKVASGLSGLSEDTISNYWKDTKAINEAMEKYGPEGMPQAVDDLRRTVSQKVQAHKADLNRTISTQLEKEGDVLLDNNNIVAELETHLQKLNPKFHETEIKEIQDLITQVKKIDNVRDLFDMKEKLQGLAKGQYAKDGQIFTVNDRTARAAKAAARESRKLLNFASPEIAEANNKLSILHDIEDELNKNVLRTGAPDSSFYGAASGGNSRNAVALRRLGKQIGYDVKGEAGKISTARDLVNAPLLPSDVTGKSAARLMLSGGAGMMSGIPGMGLIAPAVTSPFGVKTMINAAQIPRGLIKSGGKLVGDATKGFLESDLPAAVGTIGAASRGGMETVEQTQDRKISEVEAIKADPSHPMHDMIAKLPVDQAATQLNMMEGMPGVGSIRNVGRYGNLEFNPNKFKAMSGRNAKIAPGLAQPEAGSYRVLAREFTPAYGEPYIQEVVKLKDGSYKQILRDKSGEIIKSIDVNRPENTVSQTYQRGTYGEMGGHNENNRQLKRAIIENEPSDSYDVGYDFERAIRTNSNPVADIRTLDQSKRKGLLQNNPFEEKGQVIEAKEGLRPHYNKISEENMTRRETERMEKAIEGFLENPKKLSEKDYLELRLRSLGDSPYRGSHYMADIDPSLVKAIKSEYKDLAGKIKSPKGKLIRAEDVFDLWSGRPNPPGKKGKLIDRSRGLKSDD